jgi:integrase/recombinase XerC
MLTEISRFVKHMRRKNPHAETYKTYRYHLNKFIKLILEPDERQNCSPHEIGCLDVDSFIEKLAEAGLQAETINRCLTTLSSFYQFLQDEDESGTLDNPVIARRHMLRERDRLPRALPDELVKTFFNVVNDVRDRTMFTLMLKGGLRVSEVAKLTMGDLFLRERKPRIRVMGKNSKERSIYLSKRAAQTLKKWLKERPQTDCKAVFLTYNKAGIGVRGIQKRIQKYCKIAGVHLTAHMLRHTFANILVLKDMAITTIQKLLGHAWVGTTQNYARANNNKVKEDFYRVMDEVERVRP